MSSLANIEFQNTPLRQRITAELPEKLGDQTSGLLRTAIRHGLGEFNLSMEGGEKNVKLRKRKPSEYLYFTFSIQDPQKCSRFIHAIDEAFGVEAWAKYISTSSNAFEYQAKFPYKKLNVVKLAEIFKSTLLQNEAGAFLNNESAAIGEKLENAFPRAEQGRF